MQIGKLDNKLLKELVIDNTGAKRPEIISGPAVGEDCAVVDFGQYECVLSSDPITAAVKNAGALAVNVACNDIASNGVEPLGIMLTVLLPPRTTEREIGELMRQASDAAADLGVAIIGGHTEITDAVTRPLISATAIGRADAGSSRRMPMQPGDQLLVTKLLASEGTGILASEHGKELRAVLPESELSEARDMLGSVSVVREGIIAGSIGVSGMHDVTEGGILGAVWELCELSGLGAEIWEYSIPLAGVSVKICEHFGIDPYRLISSGSMLISARPEEGEKIIAALEIEGIRVTRIGTVRDARSGMLIVRKNGKKEIIAPPASDEIYRVTR
jgi:hydrogenase expression/formation protein HypE